MYFDNKDRFKALLSKTQLLNVHEFPFERRNCLKVYILQLQVSFRDLKSQQGSASLGQHVQFIFSNG